MSTRAGVDLVSVIIPSLNSPLIDLVVRAVADQQVPDAAVEVLVVGRDEPGLMPKLPRVQLIDTQQPVGPAAARNIGIVQAQGTIVVFLDADCIPLSGWLANLVSAYRAGYQVVGGGIALERTSYWALCDDVLAFGPQLWVTQPGTRRALASCNLCIDRALLREHGGFDEAFREPAGEDTDLCFRLRRAGYTLFCQPNAAVVHRHRRRELRDMIAHLYRFGRVQRQLHERYPDLFKASYGRTIAQRWPTLLQLTAPLLAAVDTIAAWTCGKFPLQFWFVTPGVILGKSAWYIGLARSLKQAV